MWDASHVLVVHNLGVVVAASLRVVIRVMHIKSAATVARNWLCHGARWGGGRRSVPRWAAESGGGVVVLS